MGLSKVRVPCYFLSCIEDHVVPWVSTFKRSGLLSNAEFALGASGHIVRVNNPVSKNRRHYWIDGEKDQDPGH